MKITTARLALLAAVALVLGMAAGQCGRSRTTASIHVRPTAASAPDGAPDTAHRTGEKGDLLTPGQMDALTMEAPGVDPASCRAYIGDTAWIICTDGTEISS